MSEQILPKTKYAQSGEVTIAYQVIGDGPRDLVVAPGYMSHLEQNWEWPGYEQFLRGLASFARVIFFDRRGTGLSDRSVAPGAFEETMDDIRAVMDAARSERAALMGGAEGGPLCILFAATFPERTSALILVDSYARRMRAPDYSIGIDEDMNQRMISAIKEHWGREGFGLKRYAPTLANDPKFIEWYAAAQRFGASPGAALAWHRVTTEIDVRRVLPTISVPTLVLHRAGDRVVPVESGRFLASNIPGAHFVELAGDQHFWFTGNVSEILDEVEEFLTGVRHAPEPDRILATILFTDIVKSTERVAEMGDNRWRELLNRHHAVIRRELVRFRGREIDTAGDGFLATFDGPARAIRCALAVIDAVGQLGIKIRAGLHTGEIELMGDKVGGIAVHIGARVMAMAGADEVLVSSTVRELVAGSGIQFQDRGIHTLKGVPEEWHLYGVQR